MPYQVELGRDDDDHVDGDGQLQLHEGHGEEGVRVGGVTDRVSGNID